MISRSSIQAVAAVALFAVSACVSPVNTVDKRTFDTKALQSDPSAPISTESVKTIYQGRTFLTYNSFHGTQAEYHGKNGISHLWYPGNSRGVPARWEVQARETGHDICWKYPSSSYNPATQQSGGSLECTPDWAYYPGVVQILDGDPFNLASGKVPFRLSKGEFSAETLAKMAGIPQNRIRIVLQGE